RHGLRRHAHMSDAPLRVLFVNSGILGHSVVARMLELASAPESGIEAVQIDLAAGMTLRERVRRRIMCAGPRPGTPAGELFLARWRHEMHVGIQAAHRIAEAERAFGRFDAIHFHPQPTAYASLARMSITPGIVSIDATATLVRSESRSGTER